MTVDSFFFLVVAAILWLPWLVRRIGGPELSEEDLHRMEMRGGRDAEKAEQFAHSEMRTTMFAVVGWVLVGLFIFDLVR